MSETRPHAGNFAAVVAELHRGELLDALDDELYDVVEAVERTGKKGKLVLTIEVSAPGRGSDQVEINAGSKATVPKDARLGSTFYDAGGRLTREDPRQAHMDQVPGFSGDR